MKEGIGSRGTSSFARRITDKDRILTPTTTPLVGFHVLVVDLENMKADSLRCLGTCLPSCFPALTFRVAASRAQSCRVAAKNNFFVL